MKIKESLGNILSGLLVWILIIIFIPIIILVLIVYLLYSPIDYIKFKRSCYQKDFPRKYSLWCGKHSDNEVYTIIKENNLPIQYFKIYEDYALPGCFLYKDILLDFSMPFFFDKEKELWLYWPNDQEDTDEDAIDPDFVEEENTDDCLTVEAVQEMTVDEFNRNISDHSCNNVVFFYKIQEAEKRYGLTAVENMRHTDGFILYEKGKLEEAIRTYIEKN